MVICPNCNYVFRLYSTICYRLIAITQPEKIKSLLKNEKRRKLYEDILAYFYNKAGEISAEEILNFLDIKKITDGDVVRTICDALVCHGILIKTKFKKGRGGHRWKWVGKIKNRCPYFLTNNECVCKDWKKIEEAKEDDNKQR